MQMWLLITAAFDIYSLSPRQPTWPFVSKRVLLKAFLKTEFTPDFWKRLHSEDPVLINRTLKTLMPFTKMRLCECGFTALLSIKNNYRNLLSTERFWTILIQPDIAEISKSYQAHPSN